MSAPLFSAALKASLPERKGETGEEESMSEKEPVSHLFQASSSIWGSFRVTPEWTVQRCGPMLRDLSAGQAERKPARSLRETPRGNPRPGLTDVEVSVILEQSHRNTDGRWFEGENRRGGFTRPPRHLGNGKPQRTE